MRQSLGRRMLAAFVLLALGLGLSMGLAGLYAHARLAEYLVAWHTRPVMDALIEAEHRAWRAEEWGRRHLYYGADLAGAMQLRFLVGKEIPPDWKAPGPGLHFVDGDRSFVLLEERDGLLYALEGDTGAFQALRSRLGWMLAVCVLVGLGVAALAGVIFARRLMGGLSRLTRAVSGEDGKGGAPASALPSLSPLPEDLLQLDDEVGVLARALAAREAELHRFIRRESFFTGDVSHELRTPLTVMQGGLEVLEMRLAALPEGQSLAPVVERLLRTTARMAETVAALLTLARRPEDIVPEPLDFSQYLCELLAEYRRAGRVVSAAGAGENTVAAAGAVRIESQLAPGVTVTAQKALLEIICKNLLDNACSYTDNGRVRLRLEPHCLEICNSGAVPEHLDIFARGVRGGQQGSVGTGLGLALALRACEHLGWRLEYDGSGAGQTVFRLHFAPQALLKE